MATVIEVVYENGVLRPLEAEALKEHQRYRVILEEVGPPEPSVSSQHFDDGRQNRSNTGEGRSIVRLAGALALSARAIAIDEDPIADVLADLRRERAAHFEDVVDQEYPLSEGN